MFPAAGVAEGRGVALMKAPRLACSIHENQEPRDPLGVAGGADGEADLGEEGVSGGQTSFRR